MPEEPVTDDVDIQRMNADELRAVLSDTIAEVTAGRITPSQANAVTRAVNKRLAAIEAALRVRRQLGPR